MAESILFNVAASLLTKLGSSEITELRFLWGIDDELERLKHTISAMEAVVLDAEEQQSKIHAVNKWILRVKDAFYEVDDLIDEFDYETLRRQVIAKGKRGAKEVRQVFSMPHQIAFRFKMSQKIKAIREKLEAIDAVKNQFHFSERNMNARDDELRMSRETSFFIYDEEVVGRDGDKKKIIDLLLNTDTNAKENVAVIAIVGMGGLGKTALAQSVYNNESITKHFELKLWVHISEEFNVQVIGKKIIESVTSETPKSSQMELLPKELQRHVNGKKYLLIMDDVWNEDHEKWVILKRLLMGGAPGSKILITTRSKRVVKTFDRTSQYDLGALDDKSAWLLFKRMAFGGEKSEKELKNSNLVEIGKEIVVKLEGHPLAIKTIGRLLYAKEQELHLWLAFKDKEFYPILGQREEVPLIRSIMELGQRGEAQFIRSIMELSYNHLQPSLKQCFLYCALFPKDYNIQKDEVIKQWMAQGFIQSDDTAKLNDIGEDYFKELLSRSFFQDVSRNEMNDTIACKMPGLMHDLACSIVKDEYVSMDEKYKIRELVTRKPCQTKTDQYLITKRSRHIYIYCELGIKLETLKLLFEAKNLRTLMIGRHSKDCQKVLNLIPSMFLRLRTLSLDLIYDNTYITLPKSIGKLKHLRYLHISLSELLFLPNSITELYNLETLILDYCEHLQELPRDAKNWTKLRYLSLVANLRIQFLPNSIVALHNLETLILRYCSMLQELPKDINKCVKLKHLDLRGCKSLTHVPKGIGELTSLQTMNLFVLKKDIGYDLSVLNRLSKLKGSLTIKGLDFCTTDELKKNSVNLQLKLDIQELELVWNYLEDEPMNIALNNDCKGVLECLQPHSNVRKIHIYGYQEVRLCDWISSNALVRLVSIELSRCFKLQGLPRFDQFPFLKSLGLKSLSCIEYIDNDEYPSSSMCLPSLEELSLVDMQNLKGWWKCETLSESNPNGASFPTTMPCLCELRIDGCPQLASMPSHAPLQLLEIKAVSSQELNMVIKMTVSHCVEEYSSAGSKLSHFVLEKIEDLEFLPKELFYHFTNLEYLSITNCKSLQMSSSIVQHPINDVLWKEFRSLRFLNIRGIPKLDYLPNGIQNMTTLEIICIYDCPNLKALPGWIGDLTSLSCLWIKNSPKLTSLSEGIHHLRSLESLKIYDCPKLVERYKEGKGKDWPKISHIPNLDIRQLRH